MTFDRAVLDGSVRDQNIRATSRSQSTSTGRQSWSARGYLFHPIADFLCLGGGSLILLALMSIFLSADAQPTVALIALLLANVINHPHFAHSYQIFYRSFARKAFGRDQDPRLRARYMAAGIVVPMALAFFLAIVYLTNPSGKATLWA